MNPVTTGRACIVPENTKSLSPPSPTRFINGRQKIVAIISASPRAHLLLFPFSDGWRLLSGVPSSGSRWLLIGVPPSGGRLKRQSPPEGGIPNLFFSGSVVSGCILPNLLDRHCEAFPSDL